MKTNALEIAALIIMALTVLASLNDDKKHVFGTNLPPDSRVCSLGPQLVKRRAYPCWSLADY